jgi:hypothetical protein
MVAVLKGGLNVAATVFIVWEGMTREERGKQTGAREGMGRFGVLCAEADRVSEGRMLGVMFPPCYWNREEAARYEFSVERLEAVRILALQYLVEFTSGKKWLDSNSFTDHAREAAVKKFSEVAKRGTTQGVDRLPLAVEFLHDVFAFYKLGMALERDGCKPKVRISW